MAVIFTDNFIGTTNSGPTALTPSRGRSGLHDRNTSVGLVSVVGPARARSGSADRNARLSQTVALAPARARSLGTDRGNVLRVVFTLSPERARHPQRRSAAAQILTVSVSTMFVAPDRARSRQRGGSPIVRPFQLGTITPVSGESRIVPVPHD